MLQNVFYMVQFKHMPIDTVIFNMNHQPFYRIEPNKLINIFATE